MEVILLPLSIGVLFGTLLGGLLNANDRRVHKSKPDGDSDIRIYTPMRDRVRGSNSRHDLVNEEEMILVIENFRIQGSPYEKKVLDAIKERIEGNNDEK